MPNGRISNIPDWLIDASHAHAELATAIEAPGERGDRACSGWARSDWTSSTGPPPWSAVYRPRFRGHRVDGNRLVPRVTGMLRDTEIAALLLKIDPSASTGLALI